MTDDASPTSSDLSPNDGLEGLAFDASNHLIIVTTEYKTLHKYVYLLQFGRCGSGDGELCGPAGTLVHSDRMFVIISVSQCSTQTI